MYELKEYKLNLETISSDFQFNKNGLTHSQGEKYKLLPYVANEKNLISEFSGVVGAFSRLISNKELKDQFNVQEFLDEVSESIAEYNGIATREIFKDIVKTMFIDGENLVNFDIKTINYLSSTNAENKLAKFLYSILFDSELKEKVLKQYNSPVENILYKLVLKALPKLKEKDFFGNEYKCYMPFIRELFIDDFKFIIKNEELYKNSLKRFLEYYYMFYVSQLCMKLNRFEKAELDKVEKIYYTLSWEKTSKNRTAYKFGWNLLKCNIEPLFAHAITLELLNHHGLNEQLGYKELAELYNSLDEEEINEQIKSVFNAYVNQIKYKNWTEFKPINRNTQTNGFSQVYKLFDAIEYQFIKSSRTRAYEAYRKWFINFVRDNFSKKRGPLGYNLNITEDDIILMTKICIKDNIRMKLNTLFNEFELRGLFFDRDSKVKIIQLYEKLNLLEKKSDSGDAQYVRSVL